jgi:hypothetical protein
MKLQKELDPDPDEKVSRNDVRRCQGCTALCPKVSFLLDDDALTKKDPMIKSNLKSGWGFIRST